MPNDPKLYLETTIPSYLTARLCNDFITARNQQITRTWWTLQRFHFDIRISEYVVREASAGHPDEAKRRLAILAPLLELEPSDQSLALADRLLKACGLPLRAASDASHVAVAAVHKMRYLLTWNCKHLANPKLFSKMRDACQSEGHACPIICTPEHLLETKACEKAAL